MKKVILFIIALVLLLFILIIGIHLQKSSIKDNETKKSGLNVSDTISKKTYNTPVIIIDTRGKQINEEDRTAATMYFYENKNNVLTESPTQIENATLKIRGNSSSNYPKKQYSIQFVSKKGNEKNVSVLGLPSGSHFALNAPFADVSLMRNYLAYDIGRKIMKYTPQAKFCQVFLISNGKNNVTSKEYMGVFLMIQKIKRSKDMVNIEKSRENSSVTSFIIEKDRYKPNEGEVNFDTYGKNTNEYRSSIINIYPKKKITAGQIDYINSYFSDFERTLYSSNFENPVSGYAKYINVNSFVDYYIINEFFNNVDAGRYSTYYYKDYKEKMNAGPIWDFNISMGNNYYNGTYYYPYGFFMQTKSVFNRLLMDRSFAEKVVNRYRQLRKTYLSDQYLDNVIDSQVKYLGPAIDNNFNKWPIWLCNQVQIFETVSQKRLAPYEGSPNKMKEFMKKYPRDIQPTTGKATTYAGEIQNLKNYISERGAWMDKNITSLYKWSS